MRLLVCGDRNWDEPERVEDAILFTWAEYDHSEYFLVISGGARGADTHAREACEKHGITFLEFPAEWDKHGRKAGPIRNQQMIDEGEPMQALAFHHDLAKSKGTKDMVRRLNLNNIPVAIFD